MPYVVERSIPFTAITYDLAFSPDGTLLALVTEDRSEPNVILRLDDGARLAAPRFKRRDLAFAPDGALFLAGTSVQRFTVGGPKVPPATLTLPGHPRGLTRIALSPNGLWAMVESHLEEHALWYLGGAAPAARWKERASSIERTVFGHDGASLWVMSVEYHAQQRHSVLRRFRLRDDGAVEEPEAMPLPPGLSRWDRFFATPHGLYAMTQEQPALRRLDANSLAPVGAGIDTLGALRDSASASPDGGCLMTQRYTDTPEGRRQWHLVHVALPEGRAEVVHALGEVSAGLIAVAPGAARVAFTRSDTDRRVTILRREERG